MVRFFVLLASIVLAGCDVYVVEQDSPHYVKSYGYETCYIYEPYAHAAEEYYEYYDHHGHYEGQCGVWYVGYGVHEERCLWDDFECSDWEYVAEFYY